MTRHLAVVWLAAAPIPCFAQQPALTAETIMARVAANQDRAEADRVHYVYIQHARILSRKGSTLMCEETTDSRVTPSASNSHIQLLRLDGRLLHKGSYVTYNTLLDKNDKTDKPPKKDPDEFKDEEFDRDLVESLRNDLTNDKSRDGVAARLFPLASKNQTEYIFHLSGREHKNGRDVYHIDFRPKDKSEYAWKGETWIDATDLQPVVVTTALARKVPIAVRTLLGTNLPGLGFTIVYAPQPDGIWFPVSFGTEFKLRVLFFFSRQIVIDAQNRGFEKTHVTSTILPVRTEAKPQ